MSRCIACLARGPRKDCRVCAIPAPAPLRDRVRQFIEAEAKRHRQAQAEAFKDFRRDFDPTEKMKAAKKRWIEKNLDRINEARRRRREILKEADRAI